MTEADIATGMRLKRQAGWNQTEGDWRRFLGLNPAGCFVGCVGGEAVATVTTAVFGRVGWIGMVLVDVSQRRQGFGRRMLERAIAHLSLLVETIKLDATEAGSRLYRHYGFKEELRLTRYEYHGEGGRREGGDTGGGPLTEALLRLDRRVYGSDRSKLLRRLAEEGHARVTVAVCGRAAGYAFLRVGENALQLGPAVAVSGDASERIVDWLRAQAEGVCFLDVPHSSDYHGRLRDDLGLTAQREFVRMYRGEEPFGGIPAKVVASSGPEKG